MKNLFLFLAGILRFVGRLITSVRNTVFNIVFLLLILVAIVAFLVKGGPQLADRIILDLALTGDIVEEKQTISSIARFLEQMGGDTTDESEILLQDILHIIDRAAKDSRIVAIRLDLQDLGSAGIDQLQAIGGALTRFKAAGKEVIAAENYYTQKQYYLASYADKVIVNPMGGVDLHGLGVSPCTSGRPWKNRDQLPCLPGRDLQVRHGTDHPRYDVAGGPRTERRLARLIVGQLYGRYRQRRSIRRATIENIPITSAASCGNGRRYGPARPENRSGRQGLDQAPDRCLSEFDRRHQFREIVHPHLFRRLP